MGIGDTEDEVHHTYEGRIESEPHAYIEGGCYLTYVPRDPADQRFRVRFATDGRVVQEIVAGYTSDTARVESCA